jgi:hypothetical protein
MMDMHRRPFAAQKLWLIVAVLAIVLLATTAHTQPHGYFVAVDALDVLSSGDYAGLPNPNFGRLTFLFAHASEEDPSSNHFHGIGAYSYTGEATDPQIPPTNANNHIPETFSGEPPLPLSKAFFGWHIRYVSKPGPSEYSDLQTNSVQALSGFPIDSPEGFLYNSSNGRWKTPLTGALIALQLVEISNGLNVADEHGQTVLINPGDVHILGDGNAFSFTPTFWAHRKTQPGTYAATFKLHDLRSGGEPFSESGTFSFDFVIPAPSASE